VHKNPQIPKISQFGEKIFEKLIGLAKKNMIISFFLSKTLKVFEYYNENPDY
jgi:hypothetical protein